MSQQTFQIQDIVIEIVKDKLGEEQINENTILITDTSCDSLDLVELCMEFEKEFGIEIPDEDTGRLESLPISKWAEYIKNVGGKVPAHSEYVYNLQRKQAKIGTKSNAKPAVNPVQAKEVPAKKQQNTKVKPIEIVRKNNTSIEFHQDGKIINLDHPTISQLMVEMANRLQVITR